jgi:hypothetical protein
MYAAATVAGLAVAGAPASAYFCAGPFPPCQAAWRHPAVFLGQIIHIDDSRPTDPAVVDLGARRRITFRVVESFRENLTSTVVVHAEETGDMEFVYQPAQLYLVYANRWPAGGPLITGPCFRTRPAQRAAEDLAYLRGPARQPAALGTIQGVARIRDPITPHALFEAWRAYSGGHVTVESGGAGASARLTTTTDRDGRFAVRAPVGAYRVTLKVGEGYETSSGVETELLDARGCASVGLVVRPAPRTVQR